MWLEQWVIIGGAGGGARLRLIAGVCTSIGKLSIVFVLNRKNDLTVYRCCRNK